MSDIISAHTPGPWLVNPFAALVEIPGEDAPICQMLWPTELRSEDETYANARLIAAAPELLAALVDILGPLNVCSDNLNVRDDVCLPIDMTMGELRKARAAIAKASGI